MEINDKYDFLKLAADRYSVRKFADKPVEKEILEEILKAGNLAPTACNNQPQVIYAITSSEGLKTIRKCTQCHFDAPAILLICYDKNECWERSFDGKRSGDIDASIVTTHMMLEAHSLGLGTTWVMYFIPEAVRTELELPDNIVPTALLALGYPSDDAKPAPAHNKRKPIEKTVKYI